MQGSGPAEQHLSAFSPQVCVPALGVTRCAVWDPWAQHCECLTQEHQIKCWVSEHCFQSKHVTSCHCGCYTEVVSPCVLNLGSVHYRLHISGSLLATGELHGQLESSVLLEVFSTLLETQMYLCMYCKPLQYCQPQIYRILVAEKPVKTKT